MTIVNQEQAKSGLIELVANLYDIRQQKSALEKLEKTLLEEIKPLVDPEFDRIVESGSARSAELGVSATAPVICSGGITLTRIVGTNRSIQADLLLERGVSPEVVDYATKATTYFQYRTKEAKNG